MKSFNEWTNKKYSKIIEIKCRDGEDNLERLLNHIKNIGNTGHSFSIIVDPESDDTEKFYWDGDGSDNIREINVSRGE